MDSSKGAKVSELFAVQSGEYHVMKDLDVGTVPLVSCGDTDNGVIGYFDIPDDHLFQGAITVAYNGSWPIMAKFHPYKFGTKDDVAVLLPRQPMSNLALLYVAALLNQMKWRYSYGRKCFKEKLEGVLLPVAVIRKGDAVRLDDASVAALYPGGANAMMKKLIDEARSWVQLL
jgi:hypothetical protein